MPILSSALHCTGYTSNLICAVTVSGMMSLYSNKLTGSIPEGMKLRNAYMLDFSRNNFNGTLPSDILEENYSKLRLLYLNNNEFSGTIPPSLMQMRKLKGIFLNVSDCTAVRISLEQRHWLKMSNLYFIPGQSPCRRNSRRYQRGRKGQPVDDTSSEQQLNKPTAAECLWTWCQCRRVRISRAGSGLRDMQWMLIV